MKGLVPQETSDTDVWQSEPPPETPAAPLFNSFLMAGFECTYAQTGDGRRMDLLGASRHDRRARSDYELIAELGIRTVREGLSWSQIDRGRGVYDFTRYLPLLEAGRDQRVQQIWDLNHFDFPEDVDPFSEFFVERFSEYAARAVGTLRDYTDETIYIVPLNEPSFFSWMAECGLWAPFRAGAAFKRQLVRAAIAAMEAMRSVDRDIRFIHTDPFMYRRPERVRSAEDAAFCNHFNEHIRFEAWDMIAGRVEPELGGRPDYLDIVGINYYFHNQQYVRVENEHEHSVRTVPLRDPKRFTLEQILAELNERYGRPLMIAETGSYRRRRPVWWGHVLRHAANALDRGLPLCGICAYPTLDIARGAGFILPKSGLWDFDPADRECRRIPHDETLAVIRDLSTALSNPNPGAPLTTAARA